MADETQTVTPTEKPATPAAPVTPEIPSQKAPDDMTARFAALAKKERASQLAQRNAKLREHQLIEREKQIAERERVWDEEFKNSPLEAIKRRGYSYEDLTKAALNDGKFQPETEIKEVKSELQRFREEQAEKERKAQEDQKLATQKAEQEAVDTFKTNISSFIIENKEKYELTSLYEADELVFQTVEEHFLRTKAQGKPKILSIDEACQLVEAFYENELERTATGSKKFQSKYQAMKAKEEAQEKEPRSSTTLTNDLASSAAPSLLPQKTENDRLKRALAALG